MGNGQLGTGGKHRSGATRRMASERPRSAERRMKRVKATASAVGVAAAAMAGAAVIAVAPTLSASPQLLASLHYLRGTNIGGVPTEQQYQDFISVVIDGTDTTPPEGPYEKVPYNAGFRPFSHGGFGDLTYNDSVQQGVDLLAEQQLTAGDMIFGYSQGAVAASVYKATHTGNTYILVENPSRPNGGVMQRFTGITIPFVDVTFSGATPNNGVDGAPGDLTIDVARQYDGWADFPRYLWNPVAIANAVMGILLLHSDVQTELTAEELEAARASGDRDYYQYHDGSNTHYYVIRTYPIPLLMPLDPILSDAAMAALDAPLRRFIETAYDRTDYSTPARASLFKPFNRGEADVQAARVEEPESGTDVDGAEIDDDSEDAVADDAQSAAEGRTGKVRGRDADADAPDTDADSDALDADADADADSDAEADEDQTSAESADPDDSSSEGDDDSAAQAAAGSDGDTGS
jgi:hypothetical protein